MTLRCATSTGCQITCLCLPENSMKMAEQTFYGVPEKILARNEQFFAG
jgi:hypothetical protein